MSTLREEILILILVIVFSITLTKLISELLFGKKEKVKYIPMPKPLMTEEHLVYLSKYYPDKLQEYLDNLPTIFVAQLRQEVEKL